jgi:hypothetical protein
MRRSILVLGTALALLAACDDDSASNGGPEADATPPDAAPVEPDAAPVEPDAAPIAPDAAPVEPDAAPVEPDAAVLEAAWVVVELDPRRPLYDLDDAVTASATAYDFAGRPIPGAKVSWSVEPPGIATIDPSGAVTLLGEGQGFAVACAAGGSCGRAAFYVDAAPPTLVVEEPARGALLGGGNQRTIRVRGAAGDGGGRVTVRVNGVPVDIADDGGFTIDVEARFGVNRIDVTADDGVRRPAVRELREVLWAPAWIPADEHGVTIPRALELRLDQALLDRDAPVALPAEGGAVTLDELAGVVGSLLRLADPATLLGDLSFGEGEGMSLRADGARLGEPDVDLYFVDDGMELFLRLGDMEITTSGHFDLEGERIALDGALHASLAAFARIRFGLDGDLHVEVDDVSVAIETLAGDFADPAADALIGTFGSRLRDAAEALTGEAVEGVLGDGLPALVSEGLLSMLDSIADVPIELDPNIEGFTPVMLRMGLSASSLDLRRRESMRLGLDARIAGEAAVRAPHEDPGVPEYARPGARGPGAGLSGGVRLEMINGILHEVWRAGLLRLSPPLPDALAGSLGRVDIDGVLPPVVAPAEPGAAFPLELQIGELRLETHPMMAEVGDVYAISIRAGLAIRVVGGRFELAVSEDPDVSAVLLAQAGARPVLPPDVLATLLEAVVWPQLQEALAGGLSLGFDPVEVDPESLQAIAPRLQGLTVSPRFAEDPLREGDQVVLEGGLDVEMRLAPE